LFLFSWTLFPLRWDCQELRLPLFWRKYQLAILTMNPKIKVGIVIAVLSFFTLLLAGRIIWKKMHEKNLIDQYAYWRVHTWPVEMKETEDKVKARQVDETQGAQIIDLKPYITAKLTDAPFRRKGDNSNDLEEMPAGTNIYAGVPFDVEGTVQLMGQTLKTIYQKTYPIEADSIPVHRKCAKIHLLHGFDADGSASKFGVTVAKLVVHYEDGSTKEFSIVSGQQAFDWWWPTYNTGNPPTWRTLAPDSELAWTGSNRCLRHYEVDASLCIYRTTFQNPQPDVAISSVDYVSTITMAAPFLVGLTVE
jgi:hypothetical protein